MVRRNLVLLVAVLLAVSFSSALMARDWIIPAAAHAAGAANTNWRSDLRIVNPSATAADVRIDLLPQGSDNTTRSPSATVTVPAQGQLSLVDVLVSKFSFSGNAGLYVSSSEPSLVVTSRTYNEAPGGATYGQFIPGVAVTDALAAGQQGHLIYVTKTADYRTNVGFAGTTATAGQVTVKLFDANGLQIGTGLFTVQPYGQIQVNDVFTATNAPAVAVARAVVTSTVPIVAYSSVIDNRTGDPIAVIAARQSEASTLLAIPGIAHLAGAGNSLWRSDVRIFHPGQGDDNSSIVLTYYAGNVANPTPITRVVSIGTNHMVALDDLLLATFGIDNGSGGLRIQSDGALLVTSRTYNQSADGTFGQDVPAVPIANGLSASATAVFSGLSDSGYRTNTGFFNLTATPIDLTLTLKRPDGSVQATKPFHLDGNMMTQINLFSFMGAGGTATASLAASGSGSGSYLAYASIVDNNSGDAVYVPAALSTASNNSNNPPSGDCVTLPFMRAGLVLGYRTSDGSYVSTQTVISDNATHTELHDVATVSGISEDIDSTFDYVVQGDLRAVTHALSKATVHSVINVLANTDITYSPGLVISPVSNFCAGATFAIPATTQTVALTGTIPGPTTVSQRPATIGTILAVRESLTTAAGTFSTVKYKSTQGASSTVSYSFGWYDITTGVLVRQQEFGPTDNLVQTLDLTSIH
jgi:hypothetical protein